MKECWFRGEYGMTRPGTFERGDLVEVRNGPGQKWAKGVYLDSYYPTKSSDHPHRVRRYDYTKPRYFRQVRLRKPKNKQQTNRQ